MRYTSIQVVHGRSGLTRCELDSDSCGVTRDATARLGVLLARGNYKNYQNPFPEVGMTVDSLVPTKAHSHLGVALVDLVVSPWLGVGQSPWLGVGTLVLSGRDPPSETQYCLDFMSRCRWQDPRKNVWCLPLPPLEIESRPLLYHVLYRLNGPKQGLDELVEKCVPYMNATGLAFIKFLEP